MNASKARKMAEEAIKSVTIDSPEPVADTTVVFLNEDGTYEVADNGEGIDGLTKEQAIAAIVDNLTSSK